MIIDFARMHRAALTYELEQELSFFPARGGPGPPPLGRDTTVRTRMHQRLQRLGYEAIVDEKILLDTKLWVAAFEIAVTIASHSVSQHQVLSARRRTNRVGLHKA